jgi:hypothetical protein
MSLPKVQFSRSCVLCDPIAELTLHFALQLSHKADGKEGFCSKIDQH